MLKLAILAALAFMAPITFANSNNNVHVSVVVQENEPTIHHNQPNTIPSLSPEQQQEPMPVHYRRRSKKSVWNNNTVLKHNVESGAEINSATIDEEELSFRRRGRGAPAQPNPLAGHNNVNNCWIILNGDTMDITRFDHPLKGGLQRLVGQCGHDATEGLHGLHQAEYDIQMKNFIIDASTGRFRMDQTLNPLSRDCDKSITLAARVAKPKPRSSDPPQYQHKSDDELAQLLNHLRR